MDLTGERFIPGQNGVTELEHLNRYYFVVNQINLHNKIVLDIASGEGYGTNILSSFSKFTYGIDVSEEAIDHANFKYKKDNLVYLLGDATKIPIQDKSIDIVVSFETIEHHDKHEEMLFEIKRILKHDGILVISSPDKYYYSDIPKFTNQFHVKELYYAEFKHIINKYFKNSYFFLQRTFNGSIITADNIDCINRVPVIVNKSGGMNNFNAIYNIAVASDFADFKVKYQSFFYSEVDEAVDVQHIIDSIKSTKTWKLGHFFMKPTKIIKNILNFK